MRFLKAGAVGFTIVDKGIDGAPIVRQLKAEDHVGIANQCATARILGQMVSIRKVHPAFLVDDGSL